MVYKPTENANRLNWALNTMVDRDTKAKVMAEARRRGVKISVIMREIVMDWVKGRELTEEPAKEE